MNKFFYFTDFDLIETQSNGQAFGSISSSDPAYDVGKEKYRLTSVHTATANPMAYAICKGQVLIQNDSTNIDRVNLILKPLIQPSVNLPRINYFIYRGLLKSSLTDGVNVADGGNTLTYEILENNSTTSQKVLGIELSGTGFSDSDNLDNAFFLPKTEFELWTVFGGWSIGTFDKDHFGIEIVFEHLGVEIDFSVARAPENVFELDKLTGSIPQADLFDHKTKKERVLSFLDPCSFYGNFFDQGLFARTSTDSTSSSFEHSFTKKSKEVIYRDLINGGTDSTPKNIFINNNCIYLDIRNDLNYSLNYFQNLGNNIKISFEDDGVEPIDVYDYYDSGWPLLRIDDIPEGNNFDLIRISFPLESLTQPLVCVLTGEKKDSIIDRIKKGKSSFKKLVNDLTNPFTFDSVSLKVKRYNDSLVVSQYFKIKYIDQSLPNIQESENKIVPRKIELMDFVFQPAHYNLLFDSTDIIKLNVFEEHIYVNLLNEFDIDYTAKVGIAKDLYNTALFFAISNRNTKSRFKAQSPSFSIAASTSNSENFFTSFISSKTSYGLSDKNLDVGVDSIQIIKEHASFLSFFKKRNQIDFDTEFFSIILSNADFSELLLLAESKTTVLYTPYLCLGNKEEALDDNGFPFLKYDLILKGLERNTSDEIELTEISTDISIYSYKTSSLI